jgi:hypothetical protein
VDDAARRRPSAAARAPALTLAGLVGERREPDEHADLLVVAVAELAEAREQRATSPSPRSR